MEVTAGKRDATASYDKQCFLQDDLPTRPALAGSARRASDSSQTPVEIDEFYLKAEPKGHEHNQPSHLRNLSTRGRGMFAEDRLPVFVLAGRGSGEGYVLSAKAVTESWIRLPLADRQQESLIVYTDGF